MPPQLHFVFAIENQPAYVNMARLLIYSIRNRAGIFAGSKITVVFNDCDDDGQTEEFIRIHDLQADCLCLPRVSKTFRYVNKYTVLRAPGLQDSADWIIQLDADTLIANPLDDLLSMLENPDLDFAGTPVLDCPVWGLDKIIAKHADVSQASLADSIHPWCPTKYPLFNGGVTFFRAQHLALFRDEIITQSVPIRNDMRIGGSFDVWRGVRNSWTRFAEKRKSLHPWIIEPYHARNYSDQIVLPVILFKHGLQYEILPHCYNWRSPDAGQGEDSPVRILHYLHARFPIDRASLFDPTSDWLAEYHESTNPGRQALANLVTEYIEWQHTSRPRMAST